jgi:PTH1 family peptidyl-tRNA hydrolase
MGDRWLIVGLGNPGPRYAGNRHNIGWHVVDQLASRTGIGLSRAKFKGRYGAGDFDGRSLVLLEPDTFMNLSGQSVSPARAFFDVELGRILVVHDELDLPFGTIRLKVGGGHAGHNGLRSIMAELGSGDFVRLRVGIGRPQKGDVAGFVLQDFGPDERPWHGDLVDRSVAAILKALQDGPAKAMNAVNADPGLPKPGPSA